MKGFADRVRAVEELVGANLPFEYVSFLRSGPPKFSRPVGVPFKDELWDVRHFHELSDREEHCQLDVKCRLVSDVLPPFAVPVASDHAGNFFCLFVHGECQGQVVWWDHERELGDYKTERVATSFSEFVASIREFAPMPPNT
jgi:hypothetical protein